MASSSPSISLVIPTLDAGRAFGTTILRATRQRGGAPQVLVVDGGSQDATRHIVNQFPEASFVEAGAVPGPRAWNRGLEVAQADVVAFLSQDAIPAGEEWLDQLTAAFADPSVAAVFGRQRYSGSTHPIAAYRLDRRFPGTGQRRRARFGDQVTLDSITFSLANAAIRRQVWKGIRFNEHLPVAADREWARQVLFASYTIVYAPDAIVQRTRAPGLKSAFRSAMLAGWTAEYMGNEVGTLYPDDARFVRAAARRLLRQLRPDQLPYLAIEDAAQRYGFRLGRRLHRLAPSLRRRLAPEIAHERPRRELREMERAA